jgi:hypothetical protein
LAVNPSEEDGMPKDSAVALLSRLAAPTHGVFRGQSAIALGVTRNQLARLSAEQVLERMHPDTYRMTAIRPSRAQRLQGALLWAGPTDIAAGRSAAELYGLEDIHSDGPEIALPYHVRGRSATITVYHGDARSFMTRSVHGVKATGVECTLLRLGAMCDGETFVRSRTILETNGRRWHDDPADYERDNEKWSVPGRYGFRLILATWAKVTEQPTRLLGELTTTLAA